MKLAGDWLLKAMSENGEPSARRVVMVVGLLIFAPALLVVAARWVPTAYEWCCVVYMGICGGVYVVPAFSRRPVGTTTTLESATPATTTSPVAP